MLFITQNKTQKPSKINVIYPIILFSTKTNNTKKNPITQKHTKTKQEKNEDIKRRTRKGKRAEFEH